MRSKIMNLFTPSQTVYEKQNKTPEIVYLFFLLLYLKGMQKLSANEIS